MAIIFGSDAGVRNNSFIDAINKIGQDFTRMFNGIADNFSRLTGQASGFPPPPPKESVYIDDGFSNVPGTSFPGSQIENIDDFKRRRVTSQEPKATVYIQKRAFRALRNENDTRFMDSGEKLLLRATKILFENKCNQIAAYEAITKVRDILSDEAELDAQRVRLIVEILQGTVDDLAASLDLSAFNAVDAADFAALTEQAANIATTFKSLVAGLSELAGTVESTKTAENTMWVIDPDNEEDVIKIGRGSGTIELTLVSNINTSLGLSVDDRGSFSFSIQDPYNLSKITGDEIEIAIASALKEVSQINTNYSDLSGILRGPQTILEEARKKERTLNALRKNRINQAFANFGVAAQGTFGSGILGAGGSPGSAISGGDAAEIVFTINPSTLGSNKVTISSTAATEVFTDVNLFRLSLLQLPTVQQLTPAEDNLVTDIFKKLNEYVAEIERLHQSKLEDNSNPDVRYARGRMRLYYLGKGFVQPMDTVHIFMRSNTFKDGQQIGPLNSLLHSSPLLQSFANDTSGHDALLEEEMAQFGIDVLNIPTDLYRALRSVCHKEA